ncbi:MAG: hypothetical protein OEY74_09220 [Gammaproteobacteria bacterium]|nr:hypothetical protein [Gammaproteobacteria bacterium]
MKIDLPKLIATSVVRGSQQGESHGGIYIVDLERGRSEQRIDWNSSDIDFEGRGADRGLRGIAFDEDDIYVAASDELFCYDRDFKVQDSFRNRYLKHSHEICRKNNHIFLTSTGFDSLLALNLETREFEWGFKLEQTYGQWSGYAFDPQRQTGPAAVNDFHINMVHVDDQGIFLSGLRTDALLHLNHKWEVSEVCSLPAGTHNARPWRGGVLFNDTASDRVRYVARDGRQDAFRIVTYDESEIQCAGVDDSKIARQGFARGLATCGDNLIVVGSSPSSITAYDIDSKQVLASVNLSMDIRNAIHGLEVWPFDA